jgi:hypothetical protein
MATDPSGTVSPPAPTPTLPSPPSSSATPPGGHRWAIVVVVVIVIALIVVGLGFANVIPGFHLSGSPAPKASTTPSKYPVTIHQSGLPSSTSWSFTLAGSTQDSSGTSLSFSEPNGSYSYSVGPVTGYSPDKSSGSIDVAGGPVSLTVTFSSNGGSGPGPTAYPVTFQETGLPAGTGWSISFNGTSLTSTGASITTHAVNGSYPYTVPAVTGYTASPSSGTATVDGAAVSYPIAFSAVPPSSFPVTFTETGLPGGASWSVDLASSPQSATGSTITFSEPNGSYPYTIGGGAGYTASPSSGSVTVHGGHPSVKITFTQVTPPTHGYFVVKFTQTGLPANVTWSVYGYLSPPNFTTPEAFGSIGTGAAIEFTLPNGTYYWAMGSAAGPNATSMYPDPAAGVLVVAGSTRVVSVQYKSPTNSFPAEYNATISETGLPSGFYWSVFVGSGGYGSFGTGIAGAPINVSLSNGTYTVDASSGGPGYTVLHPPNITIAGAPASVTVQFVPAYSISFGATGISNSTGWEVDLNGTEAFLGGSGPANFNVENGSFPYTVSAYGYTASPSNGTIVIAGSGKNVTITFRPVTTYLATFAETGLPVGTNWTVTAVLNGAPGGVIPLFDVPVDAISGASNGTTVSLGLPDGNYSWIAETTSVTQFWAATPTGEFDIDGVGTMTYLTFSFLPAETPVLFYEAAYYRGGIDGLPNGTTWGVTLGGATLTTTGMFLLLVEPNGTYSYTLDAPSGHWALPGGGAFDLEIDYNVTGGEIAVAVTFFSGTAPTALPALPPAAAASPGPLNALQGTLRPMALLRPLELS